MSVKRRVVEIGLAGAVLLGVAVLLWPALERFAAPALARAIEDAFSPPVSLGRVEIDPLRLSVTVRGLRVGEVARPKLAIDEARVLLNPGRSLRSGAAVADVALGMVTVDLQQGENLLKPRSGGTGTVVLGRLSVRSFRVKFAGASGNERIEISDGQLSVDGESNGARVRIGRGLATVGNASIPFAAKLAGELRGMGLRITQSKVTAPGAVLRAVGSVNARDGGISVAVAARADAARARWIGDLIRHPVDGGTAMVKGSCGGDLANPLCTGSAIMRRIEFGDKLVKVARLGMRASRRAVRIKVARTRIDGGRIQGAARVTLAERSRWRARARWWGPGSSRGLHPKVGRAIEVSGRLRGGGLLGEVGARLMGRIVVRSRPKNRSHRLAVRLKAEQRDSQLWRVVARPVGRARGRLGGDLRIGKGGMLAGAVSASFRQIGGIASLFDLRLGGDLAIKGSVTGSIERPALNTILSARELMVAGIPLRGLRGSLRAGRGGVESSSLTGTIGSARFAVDGAVGWGEGAETSLVAVVENLPVAEMLASAAGSRLAMIAGGAVEGKFSGRAEAQGGWPGLHFSAGGELAGVAAWGQEVGSMKVSVSGTRRTWESEVRTTEPGPIRLQVLARSESGKLAGQLAAAGLRLEAIPAPEGRLPAVSGEVAVSGELTGTIESPLARLTLKAPKVEIRGEQQGTSEIFAEASRDGWSLEGSLIGGRIEIEASSRAARTRARLHLRQLDLAALALKDPGVRVIASGKAEVAGKSWELENLAGEATLDELAMTRGLEVEARVGGLSADLDRGWLTLRRTELESASGRLQAQGSANLRTGEANWTLSGSVDLALLEVLPEVVSSSGTMILSTHGRRERTGQWHAEGRAEVEEGALDLGLPVTISDLRAEVLLDDAVLRLSEARGRVGGGKVAVAGEMSAAGCPRLQWTVDRVSPGFPAWLESRASGTGTISCPREDGMVVIGGEIELLEALYDRNLELGDLVSAPESVPRAGETGDRQDEVGLDLHVFAQDGVYVDNNVANMELAADLRILGTLEKPVVVGRLETLTGELYLANRTFNVSSGVVTLSDLDKIDPRLELFAETDVADAEEERHVWVQVSGTARDNRVKFGADDPGLSENDIVGLLALGGTSSSLARGKAAIPVSQLFALAPVGGGLEKEVVGALPVDRIDVDPSLSTATGKLEPRLTATKNLSPRLAAKMSTTLGSERARGFALEYRITPEMLLQGSWESETKTRAGAFGGGVKFRHRFMDFPRLGRGR